MSVDRRAMFELADALRNLLEVTPDMSERTVQRRINQFDELRIEVQGTEPAQYRTFCLAFGIKPKAVGANLVPPAQEGLL